ncbi:hypothetical protein ATCC90586_002833 [Pythium insidiosum]|nr:hypothetical protein ATCC90586_002833 [Pythium insidiosum]
MVSTASSTLPIAQRLWLQAERKACESLFHPFVAALAAGSLPKADFQAFLLQDAYYLHAFAKAFAFAVTKCPSSPHSLTIVRLMGGIEEELRTHAAFLESFGVELFQVEAATATPATENYVEFLLSTAKRRDTAVEIIAAMTPCMRLYAFLGQKIAAAQSSDDGNSTPYQRWIDTYSTKEFEVCAIETETLLNELAEIEKVGFETLQPLYNNAMELELRFFEQCFPIARAQQQYLPAALSGPLRVQLRVDEDLHSITSLSTGSYEVLVDLQDDIGPVIRAVNKLVAASPSLLSRPLMAALLSPAKAAAMELVAASTNELLTFLRALRARGSFDWYSTPSRGVNDEAPTVPRVLIVAGSDSGGGAGIQADMKACTNLGVFSSTAITAVTVQNTHGVHGIHAIPVNDIVDQIACVLNDIGADVVKTGMLFNEEIIDAVVAHLKGRDIPLVVDPVMVSTSGHRLLKEAAHQSMVSRLFPLAAIITPNIPEASAMVSQPSCVILNVPYVLIFVRAHDHQLHDRIIDSVDDMKQAALDLAAFGSRFVLVKGGHLKNPPNGRVHDVLLDATTREFHVFTQEKLATRNTHGTGCTLAAAIAANYAKTKDMVAAVERAIAYLHGVLRASQRLQIGGGESGPMLHITAMSDDDLSRAPPPIVRRVALELPPEELQAEFARYGVPTGDSAARVNALQAKYDEEHEAARREYDEYVKRQRMKKIKEEYEQAVHSMKTLEQQALARDAKNHTLVRQIEQSVAPQHLVVRGISLLACCALLRAMRTNTNILTLDLSNNQLNDTVAESVGKMLARNRRLRGLNLGFNNLTSRALLPLGNALKTNTVLTMLCLESNPIMPTSALAAPGMSTAPSTAMYSPSHNSNNGPVGLSSSQVAAMESFLSAIAANQTLTSLNLFNTQLSLDTGRALARALESNSSLLSVEIGGNTVRQIDMTAIANRMAENQAKSMAAQRKAAGIRLDMHERAEVAHEEQGRLAKQRADAEWHEANARQRAEQREREDWERARLKAEEEVRVLLAIEADQKKYLEARAEEKNAKGKSKK